MPNEAVDDPSLEAFKARLDRALSNLIKWELSLPIAWRLELDLKGPFQPKPFYDSMFNFYTKNYITKIISPLWYVRKSLLLI